MEPVSGTIRVIVCATHLHPACVRAVDAAIELARHHGARLVLLHVLEAEESRAVAERQLEAIARDAPGVLVEWLVARGDQGHAITRIARHENADLIITGPARPSGALVPCTVADVLERVAPCPVLSIDPADDLGAISARLGTGVARQRCVVCARELGELVCHACRDQITAEALDGQRRVLREATRGAKT